jgi:hypothetical protein
MEVSSGPRWGSRDYPGRRAPRVPESGTIAAVAVTAGHAPQENPMRAAVSAGSLYFAIVLALGFALGALRMSVLVPRLGELGAVALEVPVMLAASWSASAWLTRSFRVPRTSVARLAMGGVALGLLAAAEIMLGVLLFGRDAGAQLAALSTPPGLLGLGSQLAFGLIPFVQLQWMLRR